MQYHWLNKRNNDKLIIFFAGWSYDYLPFKFLDCGDYDVVMFYDYENINYYMDFSSYQEMNLITWSMGVFIAYLLRDKLPKFRTKLAINGTPFPIDDDYGIPQKIFDLTLTHAEIGLKGKFYKNVISNEKNFERYMQSPVERSIENRVSELQKLSDHAKNTEYNYEKFYDYALIGNNDKIVPTNNQINFWERNAPYKILETGHFPFYAYNSWEELLAEANANMAVK